VVTCSVAGGQSGGLANRVAKVGVRPKWGSNTLTTYVTFDRGILVALRAVRRFVRHFQVPRSWEGWRASILVS
jgi:hypothetical protein